MTYLTQKSLPVIALTGGGLSLITGHYQIIYVLLSLMVVDVITGLIKGTKKCVLESNVMATGIKKKSGTLMLVVLGIILDIATNPQSQVFTLAAVWLAIGNESLSIIENLEQCGVPIPKAISDRIKSIIEEHEQNDSKNNEGDE